VAITTAPAFPIMSTFWTALALVLVIEGLPLLLAPQRWRAVVRQVSSLADGQLRFFGLVLVLIGLVLLLWLARN
jgi:uncharacterized protein